MKMKKKKTMQRKKKKKNCNIVFVCSPIDIDICVKCFAIRKRNVNKRLKTRT